MTTYKIKTTSWVLWILTLLTTLFGGIILAVLILPTEKAVTIVAVITILPLTIFLQRFTSLGLVVIDLTDSDISINWKKQYIFHNRPNVTIPLSDIDSFKYQPDQNFDLFKLKLKNGSVFRFWHFTFTSGDDFEKLIADFSQVVSVYNKVQQDENHSKDLTQQNVKIKQAKTIYESKSAPFLAVFAIIAMVAIPIILFLRPPDRSKNPFVLLAPMAGAMFFLAQFLKYRKQKIKHR